MLKYNLVPIQVTAVRQLMVALASQQVVPGADQSLLVAPTASPQHSTANQDLSMAPGTARVGSSSGVFGQDVVVSAANVHDLPAAVCGSSAMRPFRLAKAQL